jgi:ABC-type multidrug transport system ATPase subunit
MFLTTHMMDEADALCNRIGIITNGILRTVSNQIRLKNLYGGGYRLDLNL